MKIDVDKLDVVLARQCKTTAILKPGVSPNTIRRIKQGEEIRPDAVGRVAKALGVDVSEIIEKEE